MEQPNTAEAEEQKCWAAVLDDPSNFATWQALLSAAEKTNDLAHVKNAYTAFLAEFPLCYVYWNKFAQHEKERGDDAAIAVYERAISALPHSVDLWVYYLTFAVDHLSDVDETRSLFERAVEAVGLDYASHPVWDKYLEFETAREDHSRVNALYVRILATPLEALASYWERYRLHVSARPLSEIITESELHEWNSRKTELQAQLEDKRAERRRQQAASGKTIDVEDEKNWIFPELKTEGDIEVEVRSKALELRERLYKEALEEAQKRKGFEQIAQRRSYFHVNPMPEPLLANWRAYLRFEEAQGNQKRVIKLYERCLVACCYYVEFWHMYTSFLEVSGMLDAAREVFERGTTIFLKQRPELFLSFGIFEESHKNIENASKIYQSLITRFPSHIEVVLRCIAFERRQGAFEVADEMYQKALTNVKGRPHAYLCLHYARFLDRVMNDTEKARTTYMDALRQHIDIKEVWQAVIAFEEAQRSPETETRVTRLYEYATQESTTLAASDKAELRQAWLEFVADYGTDFVSWRKLEREVSQSQTASSGNKREAGLMPVPVSPAKIARVEAPAQPAATATAPSGQQGQAMPGFPAGPGGFPYGQFQWPGAPSYPQYQQYPGMWPGYGAPASQSPR